MYLGEGMFYHERIREFLQVAKELEVKEIGKCMEMQGGDTFINDQVDQVEMGECVEMLDKEEDTEEALKNHEVDQQQIGHCVEMLEKDFWIWWHEWRAPIESDHITYPLFFYIFGGDSKSVLNDLKKSLLSCYQSLLPHEHWALPLLRKLLGLAALLVSYLDLSDNYGALYWGDKRSLAILVAEVFNSLHLPAETVYIELSLIQPSWFSVMVSHR